MSYTYVFRGIVIGDSNAGKTSLCQQICYGKCSSTYESTIGVDFYSIILDVDPTNAVKLQLWDTSGSESFKSVTRSYYRNTAVVFVVYDCTSRKSFKDVLGWIKDVQMSCNSDAVLVLVHNKSDLQMKSQVSLSEAKSLARDNDMLLFETSSKTGQGVKECFQQSVRELSRLITTGKVRPTSQSGVRTVDVPYGLILEETPVSLPVATTRLCSQCIVM
jgi:small GTP-binding protein